MSVKTRDKRGNSAPAVNRVVSVLLPADLARFMEQAARSQEVSLSDGIASIVMAWVQQRLMRPVPVLVDAPWPSDD